MLDSPKLTATSTGVVVSIVAVAAVTGAIFLFRGVVPVLSLGVLYVFAVLPVAVVWGLRLSLPVAVGSMLAFNFFFLPPVHTLTLTDSQNWFALAVYSGTAIVVSELAARSRRRTVEVEQRRREAGLLADIATDLLQGRAVRDEIEQIERRSAEVLGLTGMRIDLERRTPEAPGSTTFPLETAGRTVGRISIPVGEEPPPGIRERFLPALAALLAVAVDRERLARQALEAETLRSSDALKTALLRAVSHDLRSPLTAISTSVSALRNAELSLDTADREQLLETIALESDRLERLVANLLDLSRLQAGAAPPTQELWAVDQLVAQALDQVAEPERVEATLPDEIPGRQGRRDPGRTRPRQPDRERPQVLSARIDRERPRERDPARRRRSASSTTAPACPRRSSSGCSSPSTASVESAPGAPGSVSRSPAASRRPTPAACGPSRSQGRAHRSRSPCPLAATPARVPA